MIQTEAEALDRTFRALADETRRRIWLLLGEHPGASTSALTAAFPRLSRWAVMKHLGVLQDAGLVQTLPEGRGRHHFRNEAALGVARGWLTEAS